MSVYNLTDAVILLFIIFYAYSGWRKGFLMSLAGPVSFFLSIFIAAIYFERTRNIYLALGIGILGPFLLRALLALIMNILKQAGNDPKELSTISRLSGMVITVIWSGSFLLLFVILITFIPFKQFGVGWLQKYIRSSFFYSYAASKLKLPLLQNKIDVYNPLGPGPQKSGGTAPPLAGSGVPSNPSGSTQRPEDLSSYSVDEAKAEQLRKNPEVQELLQDPKIKEIFEDPEVTALIKAKDFGGLFSHPKIYKIFQDPDLVQKFLRIHQLINTSQQN